MRPFIISFVLILTTACVAQPENTSEIAPSHELWNELLQKHVTKTGFIDYKGVILEKDRLNEYLDIISSHAPDEKSWSKSEQLAYWINAYNAFTVKLIVDNYPVESIKDLHPVNIPLVSSVWQKKFFKIGGAKMNLDYIEHSILRKQFEEPRIHFAINCASVSCPPLLDEAYTSEKIEKQLEHQAVTFINDSTRNRITAEDVKISKIFNWFKSDFTKHGNLTDYLNKYSRLKIDRGVDIEYLDYDWGLNEGKNQ